MSDLTRDEIRRACEAVGWEWEGCCSAWDPESLRHGLFHGSFHSEGEGGPPYIWNPSHPSHVDADALALLVATGDPFEIQYFPGQHGNDWWEVPIHPADDGLSAKGFGSGESLQAAAVRAVNAWAESRKESK